MKTPLIRSSELSELNNCNVWLKMESAQPTGSFKQRSIGNACLKYVEKGAKKFISSSGGNAGISVAYMGKVLNIPVTVIVPKTTSQKAIDLMLQQEAEVIVQGESWVEANELALSLVNDEAVYIHPFDDQYLWDGVATIIDEVVADGIYPNAVILSVGGGSLISGIHQGLKRNHLDIPIYAIETDGTASLNTAMKMGKHIKLDEVTGIATTLAAKQVCENAFLISQSENVQGMTVSDQDAVTACLKFLDDHRTLVEPACGATLSILYDKKISFAPTEDVLVIVCGGASITFEQLSKYAEQFSVQTVA
ncbi:pyridoxal-phosphate dependent enzyme [Acinetobacter sp. NIPH 1852]|uniref:pyridoxal-phosphate dependent enzyme n=1 Tax=Acinetobacter sp. NIPH 1852 TaxID=2923428 RepID=UPI001F4AE21F|nr:pyridoxal-phosphate dependent enzyme [Acinetobacter sp. NIPH 1852]MCH7309459.1 pyridoxal-phosphate dependent enzyme [Acinetobacter sp. NIPH 1852]